MEEKNDLFAISTFLSDEEGTGMIPDGLSFRKSPEMHTRIKQAQSILMGITRTLKSSVQSCHGPKGVEKSLRCDRIKALQSTTQTRLGADWDMEFLTADSTEGVQVSVYVTCFWPLNSDLFFDFREKWFELFTLSFNEALSKEEFIRNSDENDIFRLDRQANKVIHDNEEDLFDSAIAVDLLLQLRDIDAFHLELKCDAQAVCYKLPGKMQRMVDDRRSYERYGVLTKLDPGLKEADFITARQDERILYGKTRCILEDNLSSIMQENFGRYLELMIAPFRYATSEIKEPPKGFLLKSAKPIAANDIDEDIRASIHRRLPDQIARLLPDYDYFAGNIDSD